MTDVSAIEANILIVMHTMESPQCKYVYDPFDRPNAIRVLQLLPTQDKLECTLKQINYTDGGYQALSYVWGKPGEWHKMTVCDENGNDLGFVPLTTNLRDALSDLRGSNEVGDKIFWIDQLCIDQQGDEKNHQVAMMGRIYKTATGVIVYAGPGAADEDEAARGIALLGVLSDHYRSTVKMCAGHSSLSQALRENTESPMQRPPKSLGRRRGHVENRYVLEGWRWLLQTVYGTWNERLWIVQELLLAKTLCILRGHRVVSWEDVVSISFLDVLRIFPLLNDIVIHHWQKTMANSDRSSSDVADCLFSIWRPIQEKTKENHVVRRSLISRSLVINMFWYEDLECEDPRDRIYAMLGISKDANALAIEPDYSESSPVDRVFLDVTVRILKASSNLNVLINFCRWAPLETRLEGSLHASKLSTSPSWAMSACHGLFPDAIDSGPNAHPQTFLLSPVVFLQESSILVLKGRVMDSVSFCTPLRWWSISASEDSPDTSSFRSWSQLLFSPMEVINHVGMSVKTVSSLCRALSPYDQWKPKCSDSLNGDDSYVFAFLSYCRWISGILRTTSWDSDVKPLRAASRMQIDDMVAGLYSLLSKNDSDSSHDSSLKLSALEESCAEDMNSHTCIHGRSMCVTEEGRIGNVMYQGVKGDVIAAFQGSDSLWLLRPMGKRYRLIGDAWVDGLMNGEAYRGVDFHDVDYDIELV